MNTPQIFNFEQNEVRTFLENDVPYFVANDVAKTLGYKNPSKATNDHCKKAIETWGNDSLGRRQKFKIIPESDVYRLIIKSNLPSAEKFEAWVMEEVLPQIRKHGMYATDELLNNPDLLIEVATKLKEERTLRLVAEQKVAEMQPKVNYHDIILANKSVTPISFIAKNYGMSAIQMNKLLHDFGIQYRQGKAWLLYAKYQNEGYTHIEMVPVQGTDNLKPIMKWTQKGHLFLYNFLKEHDILPNIELF
ncbi:phage antirepressor KilAC domain-containing protein [Enterococcus faecium]|uniref:phage antirepressor KilAC domain-containing protein n=1 Tax=Enterococcus faecium TaxID=1352 RepID=UPI00046E2D4B|nr:phage antirepressor [Enterococcus faecium]MCD4948056.1 phage antirepressor [Enterococcus faecium]HBK5169194.1 phage antirepressor [Enterococcus faecium]